LEFKKYLLHFIIVLIFGLVPAIICQFFTKEPTDRYIHVTSFRYGKNPSVIRCSRGDRLHLTFSTLDTGHSFFLEEFDIDAKVSPSRNEVEVFKPSDPTLKPLRTHELSFTAKHPGLLNYVVAKSNYRCHVWCGPMHAFESGKLIVMPNTLLVFSLGSLIGILLIWITGIPKTDQNQKDSAFNSNYKDLLNNTVFRKVVTSRWPQIILTIGAMLMIYIVILTSIFGTQMSGRNLGVLMMWAIWLFLLIALLTPFFGRVWCTICPLPSIGEFIQRKSYFTPIKGNTGGFNNKFSGFSMKWPEWLNNNWLKLAVFMILATFSTTMVARPIVSGITVLGLLLVPTLMAFIWELRAFCRYVCPVSVFIGPYSRLSTLSVRNKSQVVCDRCKPHYCKQGSAKGWACPYGINAGEMKENADCGVCLECTRSCLFNNVSLFKRPFATELGTRNMSEAWLTIAIFTLAIVYSILYEGHWPVIRDFVNILDKNNWDLFGIYTLIIWGLALLFVPGTLFVLSYSGVRLSGIKTDVKEVFLALTGSLLPLGLMLWIAFVIPMLFVNTTFIIQSVSDPFGWGWDFFGTANIPWHQFVPRMVPWLQAILVLTGLYFSLRNLKFTAIKFTRETKQIVKVIIPVSLFLISMAVTMIFFYTN